MRDFRFYLSPGEIIDLILGGSVNVASPGPVVVDPYSTILDDAVSAMKNMCCINDTPSPKPKQRYTSRRRALRESRGRVYRKL